MIVVINGVDRVFTRTNEEIGEKLQIKKEK